MLIPRQTVTKNLLDKKILAIILDDHFLVTKLQLDYKIYIKMGQDISKILYPPPLTFRQCFIDNKFCVYRYYFYRQRMEEEDRIFQMRMDFFNISKKRKFDDVSADSNSNSSSSYSHSRSVKKHKLLVRADDGSLRALAPTDTLWYLLYVKTSPQDDRLKKIFRARFRIPYFYFCELVDDIIANEKFSRWTNPDAVGTQPSNLKLLLLGSLRYLGRAWTFDDVHEANGISREVNRNFFSCFMEYGSTVMYKKYVLDVADSIDVSNHERLFSMAGMPGCVGSGDATHISMLNCPSWASNSHKGFKLNLPARTYNLTVTHSKVILCSTTGHPSTWNDKTIVLYDPLISGVRDGNKYQDHEFKLLERRPNGQIVEVKYGGVWFMVDNGYLDWSCTVPPVKNASTYKTIRFSEWLESMRKDVECTFGILKLRFAILRYGTRINSIKKVDQIWLTCCALHNKLIFLDKGDENWREYEDNNQSGNNSNQQNNTNSYTPFSLSRLHRNINAGEAEPDVAETHHSIFEQYTVNEKRMVRLMPLSLFRECLPC